MSAGHPEFSFPASPSNAAYGLSSLPPRPPRPPNIVLLVADGLGCGELGAYGQEVILTPRLDQLAAEGTRFTQAYAAAPVDAPSRCSLLTGRHAGHATVRQEPVDGRQQALSLDDTTVAEVLRARGYRTAFVGKWGFGPEASHQPSHPNVRGFETFFGYLTHRHAAQHFPRYLWHNGQRVELRQGSFATDVMEQRALEFIRREGRGARPFFLCLSPNLPQAPNEVPAGDPALDPYREKPWGEASRGHAAQVTRLDRLVGAVVDELRRLSMARETLVLVTSDNGPHEEGGADPELFDANGPLRGYKRNLYEGGIRVPLIAWWPERVKAGAVTDRVTPLTDVLPTLAELAGAPAPPGVDGLSAAGLLGGGLGDGAGRDGGARGGQPPEHPYVCWYRNDPRSTPRADDAEGGRTDRLAEAVRRGDWKAVRYAPGRDRTAPDAEWQVELYDLAADPGETTNVAADHPEIVTELTALLRVSWTDPPTGTAAGRVAGRAGGPPGLSGPPYA